ncbi:MAG: pyridoxamine 5'-phosphate oxidase family protein [Anaerolineae bacterium]|nr:pyridoxamine 5'-phosphate oxidase family protein [Anaerolineae bacterium]
MPDDLADFIRAQHIFFVASAPLAANGHVNLSPKGMDCLRVLTPNQVAYLDLTGSGNETSAHVSENGRITFMWCAFNGPPRILRLFGQGRTALPGSVDWAALRSQFPEYPGVRQIIVAEIDRVQTSCGFGVPLMNYAGDREALIKYAETTGEDELARYRQEKNAISMDGLPARLAA